MISKYFSITGKPNSVKYIWPKAAQNSESEVGRKVWKTVVFKNWQFLSMLNKTIEKRYNVCLWNVENFLQKFT